MFGFLPEFFAEIRQEFVVKVLATQMGITGCSFNSEDTTSDVEQRDIEGTSSQIENEYMLLLSGFRIKAVGNSGGGRLVNDTEDLKAGNGTRILCSQSLRVIEVGRDTDESFGM